MASHWVFNTAYTTPVYTAAANADNKVIIGISSLEPDLQFHKDDLYISMDKVHEQYRFLYYGKVESMATPYLLPFTDGELKKNQELAAKGRPKVRQKFLYEVKLEIQDFLTQQSLLNDVAFSLVSVYKYINPEKQFQQQVRVLPKEDYDTIVKGWIYIARTAFGKIANALPRENKLEFALLVMDKYRTIDFRDIPFMEGLDFLFDYVHKNILSQGRLLVETDNLLRENFSSEVDVNQIGLIESGEGHTIVPNLVSTQADLFRKLLEIDKKATFLNQLKVGIGENNEIEKRFHTLFKNATWPIDLTV